jgi:MATE family multidrug resistance protein
MGVGQALTALVGKSIGAAKPEQAVREVRIATVIVVAYMGSLAVLYFALGGQLMALFNNEPGVLAIGGWIMACAAVFQLFDAVGITYTAALRGAGDTFIPSVFFVASQWLMIVGGGWLVATLYPQLGSVGPWLTAACLIIITAGFLWWRWNGRAWMKIDMFGDRKAQRGDLAETALDEPVTAGHVAGHLLQE